MDHFLQQTQTHIKKIQSFLEKHAKLSTVDYDSTQEAFFCKNPSKDFEIGYKSYIPRKSRRLQGLQPLTISNEPQINIPDSLNRHIKLLYNIIGAPDTEVYIGDWTILSLQKSMENYKKYCEDGQSNIFDIALIYVGMGHVKVVSCDLHTHLLFIRNDGGSNGWDHEANYKDLLNYDRTKFRQFFFTEWFYNLHKPPYELCDSL